MQGPVWIELVIQAFEITGVSVLVMGFLLAIVLSARTLVVTRQAGQAYDRLRSVGGRSVLLGLEVLVAADIIRTVAVEPTLLNLGVLGILVMVRTFLSWSLDVELEGAWPWQMRRIRAEERREKATEPAT